MARMLQKRLFDWPIIKWAVIASLRKLNPRDQWHNPVMFVVYVTSVLTTVLGVHATVAKGEVYIFSESGTIKASAEVSVFRSGRAPSVRALPCFDAGDAPASWS